MIKLSHDEYHFIFTVIYDFGEDEARRIFGDWKVDEYFREKRILGL